MMSGALRLRAHRLWIRLACGLLVLCGLSCGGGLRETGPYNLILISIDTLRADHVGCYGYSRATTPRIDALAREGVVFDRTMSACCWTLPSHASMLTGLYPAFHSLQDDGVKLPDDVPTMAEKLRATGYHTLAVVSHVYVSSQFDLDRGFDEFDDSLIRGGAVNPVATQVVDRALQRFEEIPEGPFFAFVHFFDPHWDYVPPQPFAARFADPNYRGRVDGTVVSMTPYFAPDARVPQADLQHMIDLYDGEIAYTDAEIGRLLDALKRAGRLDRTVVVITADHGEEFKEHKQLGHGQTLYEEQLRVPLIVSGYPPLGRGERRHEVVSLVDIAPTLLEIAGAEPLPDLPGSSLLDREVLAARKLFAESIRFGVEQRAARIEDAKVIHLLQGDRRTFYDLARDPGEQSPLGQDPTDGPLSDALTEYAAVADVGWHLKLIAMHGGPLRCMGTIRSEGRLEDVRRYCSGHFSGNHKCEYDEFTLDAGGHELTIDVEVENMMGAITFATDPLDAEVIFDLATQSPAPDDGVFLGGGVRLPESRPVELEMTYPRLEEVPESYLRTSPGLYIRAVVPGDEPSEPSQLSPQTREHLESLGY